MINLSTSSTSSRKSLSTVAVVPRLKDALAADDGAAREGADAALGQAAASEKFPSFYSVISNDEDMLKIVVQVMNGMSSTATELQKYLSYWDKYKPIWEMDKESYVRRYAKANRSLKNYNDDVTKYREQQSDIQNENHNNTINFIQIDCTLLKTSLVNHCVQWQNKLLGLLNQNALGILRSLHDKFETETRKLQQTPGDLKHLSASIECLRELQRDSPSIEAKIAPLEEMYSTLSKFDVQITDDEVKKLSSLNSAWGEFQEMLIDSETMLEKAKQNMKRDLMSSLENWQSGCVDLYSNLTEQMPTEGEIKIEAAFEKIGEFQAQIKAVQERKVGLKMGLDLFETELPEPKELAKAEKDLKLAEDMWTLRKDWTASFDSWKTGQFDKLDVEDMTNQAGQFTKKIGKLKREIARWDVWELMQKTVREFVDTMPLITDLKNPALRERHWNDLKAELHKDFDQTGVDFTLEKVFAIGLATVAEFIGELSSNANKELAIETALEAIEGRWIDIVIDVTSTRKCTSRSRAPTTCTRCSRTTRSRSRR